VRTSPNLIALLPVLGLSACASSGTPLIFGSTTTFGITVNATPDTQGFDFTLGYKDKNLAIVPVAVTTDGKIEEITSWSKSCGDRRDALSVFGQFTSKGDWTLSGSGGTAANTTKNQAGHVNLDRFFATGIAASHLANGYRNGMKNERTTEKAECVQQKTASPKSTNEADNGEETATTPENQDVVPPISSTATEKPSKAHQIRRLIYGQSNTIGIGISVQTSLAEQGPNFTLGYSGRDIAFIPTMEWHADGRSARLASRDQLTPDGNSNATSRDSREVDAFSVFGQFSATTQTQSIDYGLSRFFSTGLAARNLADGFEALIERQLKNEITDSKTTEDKKEPNAPKK